MSAAVKQQEAQLFVSCAPDADTKAIEAQLKAVGARPQGTIGRRQTCWCLCRTGGNIGLYIDSYTIVSVLLCGAPQKCAVTRWATQRAAFLDASQHVFPPDCLFYRFTL